MAVAVLGAGAPGIAVASGNLTDSQRLVTLSELNAQAVALAHSLADERDIMTEFVAAGRSSASGSTAVSESRRASVDRQIAEIRADAPAELRRLLATLPDVRQQALSGTTPATDTYEAYTEIVQALHAVADDIARALPARASGGPTDVLPALGHAVEEASATRGLLLGALAARGTQPALSGTAQRTYVQEQAALADFDESAPKSARDRYANTVNGTEISTAERYLARLTDQPGLSPQDLALSKDRIDATLSGRIDRMRAVESALTTAEVARLAQLRDDDVTELELRIAIVGACLLIAVGVSTWAARSMTRPLAVLRLGTSRVADDPVAEEPVKFTGRNDEFAEAVRAVNRLHATAVRLHEREGRLGEDRTRLVGERQRLADECEELRRQLEEATERLAGLEHRVHGSFVNLALRTLGLVERQLSVIEGLEDSEQDPDRLDTLFKLDHLATRMRRHSENLLVVAGSEHHTAHGGPVPLLDVLRAAISEIERYERVEIQALPPRAHVAGFAADAISHLVAELLENATAFSPPDAKVELSGWLLESGEVMLSVQDEGIGMTADRLQELNARLADPHPQDGAASGADDALGLGLYVVARLAARHGVRVQLREQKQGGVTAVVVLPKSILPTRTEPVGPAAARDEAPAVTMPGSEAEANSNALPRRVAGPLRAVLPEGRREAPAEAEGRTSTPEAATEAAEVAESASAPAAEAFAAPGSASADDPVATPDPDPLVAAAEAAVEAAGGGTPSEYGTEAGTEPAGGGTPSEYGTEPAVPGQTTDETPVPEASGTDAAAVQPEAAGEMMPAEGGAQGAGPATASATAPAADLPGLADGPYAIGPDEHARAEDDALVGDVDTPSSGTPDAVAVPKPAAGDSAGPALTTEAGPQAPNEAAFVGGSAAGTPVAEPYAPDPAMPAPAESERPAPADSACAETAPADPAPAPAAGNAPKWERVTDKGLPKRTPKVVTPTEAPPARTNSVNAEELRRRLGGFYQGARDGRRDAEAEIAERTGQHQTGALDDGETVEEARG